MGAAEVSDWEARREACRANNACEAIAAASEVQMQKKKEGEDGEKKAGARDISRALYLSTVVLTAFFLAFSRQSFGVRSGENGSFRLSRGGLIPTIYPNGSS